MPRPNPNDLRRTGADAAVFDDRGRLLLQKRSDFHVWGLPGGSIEVGETVTQAVVREVKEESGLDVRVVRLIGVYSEPQQTTTKYPSGDVVHYVSLTFECAATGGALRTDAESDAAKWFPPDALPDDILPEHSQRIADAFARRPETVIR